MQIKVLTKLTEMAEILPGGGRWNRQRSALLTSVARQGRNRLPGFPRWVRLVDSSNRI
jgi:hypothetical protein